MKLFRTLSFLAAPLLAATPGYGQGAPSVGVEKVERTPVTQSTEFIGRIEATNRVAVIARVTAFVEKVNFADGAEVKKGDLLYQLERGPFQADLDAKKAVAEQYEAQLVNANLALERAQSLLKSNAGAQATVDAALASQKALAAQLLGAKASVEQSQINLDYTTIASPIDGKIGRTAITIGNVVSPGSGTLVTIVGQDPMYVTFPVSVRTVIDLRGNMPATAASTRSRSASSCRTARCTRSRASSTSSTIPCRRRPTRSSCAAPSPTRCSRSPTRAARLRELSDNEFVTVLLEGVKPIEMLTVPRAAVLMDQQGEYVYVVDRRQQGAAASGEARPVDAGGGRGDERAEGGRAGGDRGHPAGQGRPARAALAADARAGKPLP